MKEQEIGVRYAGGQLVYSEEAREEDEDKLADRRTFKVIKSIRDSIYTPI